MKAAKVDASGIVQDLIVVAYIGQIPGFVACPDWVGIGMHIDTPEPQRSLEEIVAEERLNNFKRELYEKEADPLFFKWQRGEVSREVWVNKVYEIKSIQFVPDGEIPATEFE
jgi:hypothetical protein